MQGFTPPFFGPLCSSFYILEEIVEATASTSLTTLMWWTLRERLLVTAVRIFMQKVSFKQELHVTPLRSQKFRAVYEQKRWCQQYIGTHQPTVPRDALEIQLLQLLF